MGSVAGKLTCWEGFWEGVRWQYHLGCVSRNASHSANQKKKRLRVYTLSR